MWTASVESNLGEVLNVRGANGTLYGRELLNFQAPLDLYCLDRANDEQRIWFSALDRQLDGQLCQLMRPVLDALIAGDWKYGEDEYEIYDRRYRDTFAITEQQFKQGLERAREAWKPIEALLTGLGTLLEALRQLQSEETHWYNHNTIDAFEALITTLQILAERGGTRARITID